jgi:hypothetical protein
MAVKIEEAEDSSGCKLAEAARSPAVGRRDMAGVRLKFSDLYRELEASKDPSSVLDVFLGGLGGSRISIDKRYYDSCSSSIGLPCP